MTAAQARELIAANHTTSGVVTDAEFDAYMQARETLMLAGECLMREDGDSLSLVTTMYVCDTHHRISTDANRCGNSALPQAVQE